MFWRSSPTPTPRPRFLRGSSPTYSASNSALKDSSSPTPWTWAASPCVLRLATPLSALFMPPVPEAAFSALLGAVKSGQISQDRLDASVRRILQAKARLGLQKTRLVDVA